MNNQPSEEGWLQVHKTKGCLGCYFVDDKAIGKGPACTYAFKLILNEDGTCAKRKPGWICSGCGKTVEAVEHYNPTFGQLAQDARCSCGCGVQGRLLTSEWIERFGIVCSCGRRATRKNTLWRDNPDGTAKEIDVLICEWCGSVYEPEDWKDQERILTFKESIKEIVKDTEQQLVDNSDNHLKILYDFLEKIRSVNQ